MLPANRPEQDFHQHRHVHAEPIHIDFPQAVDPRFNGNALAFLQRDLENVGRFCARFAEIPDPRVVALEIWSRFQRGETPAS